MNRPSENEKLPLMEAFYSLQGEGTYSGSPAYFIRLAGCQVQCHWCDVKDSWSSSKYPQVSCQTLASKALESQSEIVIITGGEPLMYNLDNLTNQINKNNQRCHLETSGVYPSSGQWDWICFSPKKFKNPQPQFFDISHELKVVIYHVEDLKWAESLANKMHADSLLYLQPEWSKSEKILPIIIEYIKKNKHWKISLQSHKYMNIP